MKKKTQTAKRRKSSDEMSREYRFDYSKARPNRFASKANQLHQRENFPGK
jgi:hypothetical protein